LTDDEEDAIVSFLNKDGQDELLKLEDLELSYSEDIPWVATGHNEFKDPEGFPANKPPWGLLNAIDLDKGELAWQVPLGTYPELEARGLPATGTFNMGGPLVTAGGLVFIGASMDERFRAFDKTTGEQLWMHQLEAGAYATPSTFEVDGKQFVVIAGGGGGKPGTKSGNKYYCFALP
ncbi:MAG: PQQ-binding-like beta-propeller repeat protein, partial [Saprospiraceae bacterium]|nr:PQQ-binding-like beta-propeller repeat protein [Saprospiraceae bacterium]